MEKKNIIIGSVAIVIGLLLGYFMFGGEKSSTQQHTNGDGHDHSSEQNENQIWTCSMHPQIKLPEPGDCPICGMDLILLETNANANPLVIEMTNDAIKLSNIQTSIVGGEKSTSNQNGGELKLSGKLKANETTSASIVSHIPGRIEKLYISFTGERVSKGQKIATIYSPNLITAQKELLESYKVKEVNPSLFEATKNKLKYWKITDKQIDDILSKNQVKESFNIYADHSGVVTKRKVSVGDHLMEGGILFEIQNLNKLWAVFDVYESDLSKIKKGDVVTFNTTSVPNKTYTAKISFIDPVINPKTRAGSARVEINNSKNQLMPEMFINGILSVQSTSTNQSLSIPKTAVLWTGERSVVYVKLKNTDVPSFEFREVSIGESNGDNYVVLNGIKAGDEIVTNGAFVIDASAQLNNQASMMNRNVNTTTKIESETESEMKCEAGKCGSSMKEEKQEKEMKCEVGKCGGDK